MKKKNIIILFCSLFIVSFAPAAHLEVFNETDCDQYVEVLYSGNNQKQANVIKSGEPYTFKSGIYGFHTITWRTFDCTTARYSTCFFTNIFSPATMLSGKFTIHRNNDGTYVVNFDKNGASKSKERTLSDARSCSKPK